jgi:nucleotide-binding universal stress UspA family protein
VRPLTLRTVLAAADLDRSSDVALEAAHCLANAAGAALHVVHVLAPGTGEEAPTGHREGAADAVRAALRRAKVPENAANVHIIPGPPADTIRSLADRIAADVVVIGPHRQREGAVRGPLGGTARAVAARAFAPCLVVGQPLRLPLQRVLVPIDLSDTARGALLVALSWASALRSGTTKHGGTTLTVLHVDAADEDAGNVGVPTSVDRELERLRRDAGKWAGVTVRGIDTARSANAAQTIVDYTADLDADLVVVGTRGLGLDEAARLGSVSASLATRLQTPLLLVPPAVWRAHELVP